MARKFKSPGKAYKAFGQRSETSEPGVRSQTWLASRMEMLNVTLFTFFAILGYVQYFVHRAPAANSLVLGVGFTVILALYLFLLRHRHRRR